MDVSNHEDGWQPGFYVYHVTREITSENRLWSDIFKYSVLMNCHWRIEQTDPWYLADWLTNSKIFFRLGASRTQVSYLLEKQAATRWMNVSLRLSVHSTDVWDWIFFSMENESLLFVHACLFIYCVLYIILEIKTANLGKNILIPTNVWVMCFLKYFEECVRGYFSFLFSFYIFMKLCMKCECMFRDIYVSEYTLYQILWCKSTVKPVL